MSAHGRNKRGFASMDPERQRAIAKMGGKAAHKQGVGHEWTREQAQRAGSIGGRVRAERMRAEKAKAGAANADLK